MVSTMWTGMRIVRAWSAIAQVLAAAGGRARPPRVAQKVRDPAPGLVFDRPQLRAEYRGARGRAIEVAHDLLDLPAVQSEPAEGREEACLVAPEPRAAVGASPIVRLPAGRPVGERIALLREMADGRELPQEPATVGLVVLDRLALLLGLVPHEVAELHLAGPS